MVHVSLQALADRARGALTDERFLHVLGVAHLAVALADRHGIDTDMAAVAALLHDQSKSMKPAEIEADLERRGVSIPDEDRHSPATWHGLHAATLGEQDFGLKELEGWDEIAEAVALHSTADRDVGPLTKILFMADALEPGRVLDGAAELRRAAREDLDGGFRQTLKRKCAFMEARGTKLNSRAVRALAYYDQCDRSEPTGAPEARIG